MALLHGFRFVRQLNLPWGDHELLCQVEAIDSPREAGFDHCCRVESPDVVELARIEVEGRDGARVIEGFADAENNF